MFGIRLYPNTWTVCSYVGQPLFSMVHVMSFNLVLLYLIKTTYRRTIYGEVQAELLNSKIYNKTKTFDTKLFNCKIQNNRV